MSFGTRTFIVLMLLLSMPSPFTNAQESKPKASNNIFEFRIHPQLPPFQFKLIWRQDDQVVDKIEVYKVGNLLPIQVLQSRMDESPFQDSKYFQAEDINFDGYKDIKLLIMWGATGNLIHDYYIFDPNTGKFVFNKAISDLLDPVPNPDLKELEVYARGGMAGQVYSKRKYKLQWLQPVLIWEETQDWNNEKNTFIKTEKELKDGKMVLIKREEHQ